MQGTRIPSEQTPGGASPGRPTEQSSQKLLITVVDENSVAVPSARVVLTQGETPAVWKGETDYAGRFEFDHLPAGLYRVRVEKEGYFVTIQDGVRVGETSSLEIVLNHQKEYVETVNVVYSPPAIDPAKTAASESLNSEEIINLPFPVTRDIRYALPLLPGIVQDAFGQVHVDGSSTRQIFDDLDGFDITDPTSGAFDMRVSVDALRSVDVESSRYPAEFGKGSGGVLSLRTGMGDDRFRFSSTDFLPNLQNRRGIHLNTWTPRVTFSGPMRKGKAWYLDAMDGDYNLNIFKDLPPGADQNTAWRVSNLAKTQVNLAPGNILTTSFVVNHSGAENAGLSPFNPLESTVDLGGSAYLFSTKDQAFLSRGILLEVGLGLVRFHAEEHPQGVQEYVITPDRTGGNFFETAEVQDSRVQGIANLTFPPLHWHGRHEFRVGTDLDRSTNDQAFERRPIQILREDGTLSRLVTFLGRPPFSRNNFEASAYAQDRWVLSDRWLVEPGVREDWDEVVRRLLVSPRLASNYLLRRDGDMKLTAGVGVYYDATALAFLTRPLTAQRFDLFYDATGKVLVRPPVETTFLVNERALEEPRFLNWSVGLERKLPASIYLLAQFVQKRGRHGWAFINQGAGLPGAFSGEFALANVRRDHYDSVEVSARRMFKGNHIVFASYTRSAARSSAVLNFNIDSPLFSQQAAGPLPWDTPNRFISWGWMPLWRGFDLGYSLDWHDGFPFSLVNQNQELVGSPGARRFPTFLVLNMQVEKRFPLFGFQWALRAGFDDLTDRANPSFVDNNVDSPRFLTFGGIQGRALTGRIRLLGRK